MRTFLPRGKQIIITALTAAMIVTGTAVPAEAASDVSLQKKSATLSIKVNDGKKVYEKTTIKIKKGKKIKIKKTTFKSNNNKIASVSKKGVVQAKKEGSTDISVTVKYKKGKNKKLNNKKFTFTVKIKDESENTNVQENPSENMYSVFGTVKTESAAYFTNKELAFRSGEKSYTVQTSETGDYKTELPNGEFDVYFNNVQIGHVSVSGSAKTADIITDALVELSGTITRMGGACEESEFGVSYNDNAIEYYDSVMVDKNGVYKILVPTNSTGRISIYGSYDWRSCYELSEFKTQAENEVKNIDVNRYKITGKVYLRENIVCSLNCNLGASAENDGWGFGQEIDGSYCVYFLPEETKCTIYLGSKVLAEIALDKQDIKRDLYLDAYTVSGKVNADTSDLKDTSILVTAYDENGDMMYSDTRYSNWDAEKGTFEFVALPGKYKFSICDGYTHKETDLETIVVTDQDINKTYEYKKS